MHKLTILINKVPICLFYAEVIKKIWTPKALPSRTCSGGFMNLKLWVHKDDSKWHNISIKFMGISITCMYMFSVEDPKMLWCSVFSGFLV